MKMKSSIQAPDLLTTFIMVIVAVSGDIVGIVEDVGVLLKEIEKLSFASSLSTSAIIDTSMLTSVVPGMTNNGP